MNTSSVKRNQQPNSEMCFVCGRSNPNGLRMTFFDNGQDEVFSDYAVDPRFQGYPGIVHGGIVVSILDEVVGRVAMIDDPHRFMMSVSLNVKFRKPVPTETPIHAVGRIVRMRGRLAKAEGFIELPDGTIASECTLTLADIPSELLSETNQALLQWHVDS